MKEKTRLCEICTEEKGRFYRILNGNVYCSLAYSRRVDCPYLSDHRDVNGLYLCNYPKYIEERDLLFYTPPWNNKMI